MIRVGILEPDASHTARRKAIKYRLTVTCNADIETVHRSSTVRDN